MEDARTVTAAIVTALRNGPISHSNLGPDSVSSVSLLVGGASVHVSWYSDADPCSGNARDVVVNNEWLPVSSRQTAEIVRAAQQRARDLQKQKLAFLAGRGPDPA